MRSVPSGVPTSRRGLSVVVAVVLAALVPSAAAQAQQDPGEPGDDVDGVAGTAGAGRDADLNQPTGQVAYVTPDRRVWVGVGDAAPTEVGALAALGTNGQAAVAIAPTADAVAYVRADGALLLVGPEGGDAAVVATDVALDAVGTEPVLAWDGTGKRIAYVAVGTREQVADSSTRARSKEPGTFLSPLPNGPLGSILKVVDRQGVVSSTLGDPSLRSVVGVTVSPADPVMLVDSVIPGTTDRYTLAFASGASSELVPTPFSADEPDFAPDGSFVVFVGPAKGRSELIRVDLDDATRTTIALEDRICGPAVSPDATRIVYGAGEDCNRLMVISSNGGRAFDITPSEGSDGARFGLAALGWTTDGRFVTLPACTTPAGDLDCGGPSVFLEPDTGRVLPGPDAVTLAPVERPLIQEIWLDFQMRGPLEASHSFRISAETQGALTDTESGEYLEATLTDDQSVMTVRLAAGDNSFVTGTIAIDDPEAGVDRTFTVLGRTTLLGLRIVSVSGIWMSTSDLPFTTGEFNMAIRRR